MSISSATRKAGPYTGNASTTAFPFAFKVFNAADVLVVSTDLAGIETNLTLTTHYTVALNADQDATPGGTVDMLAAPAVGYLTTITSQLENKQPVTLANQGGFYPKVINDALDRLTILIQQIAEGVGRSVKVGISSNVSPDDLVSDLSAASIAAVSAASSAAGSAASASDSASAAALAAASIGSTVTSSNALTLSNKTLDSTNNIAAASGQLSGFRNVIINGNFQVNQRAYVSGAAVGTNLYGHDRWKMAASADTYAFSTSQNVTTVTIPAGKVLRQVIEGVELQSGTYTLSWEGTAQGKIGAGVYGASGITGTVVGGTNLIIEFGLGTVSKVQFEFGSVATPFENRPSSVELLLGYRYYRRFNVRAYQYCPSTGDAWYETHPLHPQMRATPTAAQIGAWTPTNVGSVTHTTYPGSYVLSVIPAGAGMCGYAISGTAEIALSAEL